MCIIYIHNNPVNHGFCQTPKQWKYSFYNSIVSKKSTKLKRTEVLEWFESQNNFICYHNTNVDDIFAE